MSLKGLRLSRLLKNGTPYFQLLLEGSCVSQAKQLSTIRDYLQRHYLTSLGDKDKSYYSKLVMLQLENHRGLEMVEKQLEGEGKEEKKEWVDPLSKIEVDKRYLEIIEASREVYSVMGWGWGESAYREALTLELTGRGYQCGQEVSVPIVYKNVELSHVNSRLDILARRDGEEIVIELKSDSASRQSMERAVCQCRRYLGLRGSRYGMVVNFPDKCVEEIEYEVVEC